MKNGWILKTITAIFTAGGLLALAYCAFDYVSAQRYQMKETERFTAQLRAQQRRTEANDAAAALASIDRPYPNAGAVVALLSIPRVGLSAVVVEGAGTRELKWGPGHIPGTPLPGVSFPSASLGSTSGRGANTGIAGHRDTFFRPLRFVRINDAIKVSTREREYLYKVVSTRIVGPEEAHVLDATGHETLTLVTCYPFDFVGAAPKRFIVRADAVPDITNSD